MPRSVDFTIRRSGTSKDDHAADRRLITLLHSHPVNLQLRNDAFLVLACDLFQDRVAAFATVIDHLAAGNAKHDELRCQADGLRTEWQAIAQAVTTTPAAHLAGLKAKADSLRCYFDHIGASEGIEIDLARSLAADLRDVGSE